MISSFSFFNNAIMNQFKHISCSEPTCEYFKKKSIHKEPKNLHSHCFCCKNDDCKTFIKLRYLLKLGTNDKGIMSLVHCADLLRALTPKYNTEDNKMFLKAPFGFAKKRSNKDILESLAESFMHVYNMTYYAKKGKNPKICKWDVHGLSNYSGYKKETYVRVATIIFRDYEIYTECYDTLALRECHTLAVINSH